MDFDIISKRSPLDPKIPITTKNRKQKQKKQKNKNKTETFSLN